MTRDQFTFQFRRLVKAFNVTRAKDREEIYFEKLERFSAQIFSKACEESLSNDEKLPTIAKLMARCDVLSPKKEVRQESCQNCDGYGWVMIAGEAYRGNCSHGNRLGAAISVAPAHHVGQQGEAIKNNAQWKELYGKERPTADHMRNKKTGAGPHWWIERDQAHTQEEK
jgi:hypothetical protein